VIRTLRFFKIAVSLPNYLGQINWQPRSSSARLSCNSVEYSVMMLLNQEKGLSRWEYYHRNERLALPPHRIAAIRGTNRKDWRPRNLIPESVAVYERIAEYEAKRERERERERERGCQR